MPKSEKMQTRIKNRRVKDAPRITEEWFGRIFEQSTLGMAISDHTFHFVSVNPAFCAMLGYAEAELLKLTFKEITHPDNLVRDTESIRKLAAGEIQSYKTEKRYITKSGDVVDGSLTVTALHDASGKHVHSLVVLENITQRKQADTALRESEGRFRKIVEHAPIAMAVVGMDETIDFINRKAVKVFGFLPEDIPTMAQWWVQAYPNEAYRKEVVADWTGRVRNALTEGNEIAGNEYRVTCKDGAVKTIFISGVPVADKIFVMFDDITEHKRAEEARRESEENFRVLFDENPMPTLMSEMPSGRMNFVNKRLAESVGRRVEDMVGRTPNEIGLLNDPADQERLTGLIAEKGYVDNLEFKKTFPDGSLGSVSISMRLVMVHGKQHCMTIIQDVTERRRMEAALQESEQKYRELANTVPVGIFEFDPRGKLTFVNKTLYEWFGYTEAEVEAGINILDLADPTDRQRLRENMGRILTLQYSPPREYCLARKNGDKIQVLALTKPILDQGHVQGFRGILLDLTEKKKTEHALQHAAKLDSLGILAGGIAHDFNNLLTGIYGYLDLARSKSRDAQISEYLEAMLTTMTRAKALTLQLLTFAKGGSPVQKLTPLFPFVQDTAQFALSGSNISCRFSPYGDLWPCNIDKDQIAQVIDNIVINAQQAMPDGGAVEISAANVSFREDEHPPLAMGDYVKVSIKDSGIGIPREIMPRIFDPFYTTKLKGHGLGLATSYSIISRHGGCIDVESEPGRGSTFHFYLPASSETPAADRVAQSTHKGSGTIIVMDDEAVVRDTFRHMLEMLGYAVVCKNDGREALAFYESETRAGRKFTAMIFDLTVAGGMGGMEAIAELRQLNMDMPVFVASGYADNSVMKKPDEWGFTASISKPFTVSDIADMLNRYLKA
jgi:PAS domain S-box-containing protein